MADIKFEKRNNMTIRATERATDLDNGGHIDSQTVEANLMYAILEKLEDIHCLIVKVSHDIS